MSQTLYRKYRPQTFADVIDQNATKVTLQNEIVSDSVAHAYLFTGPRGTGKTSLARILAKSLNCLQRKEKKFEPCNNCAVCNAITAGKDLDLIEIDAATHTQVDKVRENIVENIKFAPHNKHKIFIIDEVHMLSTAAFNALLKTLEEPPEYAVFILCTTEAYKLPETIISRCQRFDFKKISAKEIAKKLRKIVNAEKIKISDEVLQTIALRSGGFARDAESLLGQIIALLSSDKKEITLDDVTAILPRSDIVEIGQLIDALINKNASKGIEIINKLVADGVDLERFNLDLIDYLRKIILIKINLKSKDENIATLPEEVKNKLIAQAEEIDFKQLIQWLEKFMLQQKSISAAEISQLPLEMVVVEVCSLSASAPHQSFIATADKLQNKNKMQLMPNTNKSIDIKLEKIKEYWPEILKQSHKLNHSLPLILKNGYPYEINNDILKLVFEFGIHAEKLKDNKNLTAVENLLAKILGKKIKIQTQILDKEKIQTLKSEFKPKLIEMDEDQLNSIADSFGGKIVE
ncbi:DNA polymerase III subunit gamma/tau [Candidatus Parcubacteria bacterium]|nr:DNA polymerase III subunit gamma/tau [Patescibacteria group bacterium]MBU4482076.1 DNA polymerase III subunit gamma/tau [Patescibacteria group bacterium]MCG2687010.1 DNA polymerase III subunit gamma/tau [Candidatus Parcubacteria bacterium]